MVLTRLAETDLAPFLRMYSVDFLRNASLPLVGNDVNLHQMYDAAVHNAGATDDDPRRFLVVKGVPGSGKTRLGYESLRMWNAPDRLRDLADAVGGPVHPVRLFLDFNNGGRFSHAIDGDEMGENLGARLAAQALGLPLRTVHQLNGGSLTGLTVAAVLGAVLRRAEDQLNASSRSMPTAGGGGAATFVRRPCAKTVFLLVVHLDEYQTYMFHLARHRAASVGHMTVTPPPAYVEGARLSFKEMLSALNDFARSSAVQEHWRVILLPIASGTPVLGVPMLATDKLAQRLLSPTILDRSCAEQLVASVLTCRRDSDDSSLLESTDDVVLPSLRCGAARLAIGDSGFRPRLLVNLGVHVRRQTERIAAARQAEREVAADAASCLALVDWRAARDAVAMVFHDAVGLSGVEKRSLVRAALLQTPVRFVFPVDEGPSTLEEKAVRAAEAAGLVHLEATEDEDYRIVRMPLMQVKEWGPVDFLPPSLVDVRSSWAWITLEHLCAHILRVRLNYLAGQELGLFQLFPGSLGAAATRQLRLRSPARVEVFREQCKFINRLTDVPAPSLDVQAAVFGEHVHTAHALTDGIFCTCPGTAWVDLRFSLRLAADPASHVHIIVQTKHTLASRTVAVKDVLVWHAGVRASMARWRDPLSRTVFVFVSNRRITDAAAKELASPAFFDGERSDLIVCTSDQLAALLTPTLVERGFLHAGATVD